MPLITIFGIERFERPTSCSQSRRATLDGAKITNTKSILPFASLRHALPAADAASAGDAPMTSVVSGADGTHIYGITNIIEAEGYVIEQYAYEKSWPCKVLRRQDAIEYLVQLYQNKIVVPDSKVENFSMVGNTIQPKCHAKSKTLGNKQFC